MKKLLLTVITVCICYFMNAQDDVQLDKKLKFGVKAGVNFANVTGNGIDYFLGSDENSENRLGLNLGGLVEYRLFEKVSLQGELTYSQQGFKKNYADENYKVTLALDYLNLPVLIKYYITDELNLELGPQLGFLLAAKSKEKDEGEKYEEDAKEYFNSTDFGLLFGLGYQLENGLGINARYNLGITRISDSSRTVKDITELAVQNFELRNRVFSISLFYTF